jgi:hypothetical protein
MGKLWAVLRERFFGSKRVPQQEPSLFPRSATQHSEHQHININSVKISKARAARIAARSNSLRATVAPSAVRRDELDTTTFLPESKMYFSGPSPSSEASIDIEDSQRGGDFGGAGATGWWGESSTLNTDCTGSSGGE